MIWQCKRHVSSNLATRVVVYTHTHRVGWDGYFLRVQAEGLPRLSGLVLRGLALVGAFEDRWGFHQRLVQTAVSQRLRLDETKLGYGPCGAPYSIP